MLNKTTIEVIKKNQTAIGRIADVLGRSTATITDWLNGVEGKKNNGGLLLTSAPVMQIIREETGLTDDEILSSDKIAS